MSRSGRKKKKQLEPDAAPPTPFDTPVHTAMIEDDSPAGVPPPSFSMDDLRSLGDPLEEPPMVGPEGSLLDAPGAPGPPPLPPITSPCATLAVQPDEVMPEPAHTPALPILLAPTGREERRRALAGRIAQLSRDEEVRRTERAQMQASAQRVLRMFYDEALAEEYLEEQVQVCLADPVLMLAEIPEVFLRLMDNRAWEEAKKLLTVPGWTSPRADDAFARELLASADAEHFGLLVARGGVSHGFMKHFWSCYRTGAAAAQFTEEMLNPSRGFAVATRFATVTDMQISVKLDSTRTDSAQVNPLLQETVQTLRQTTEVLRQVQRQQPVQRRSWLPASLRKLFPRLAPSSEASS